MADETEEAWGQFKVRGGKKYLFTDTGIKVLTKSSFFGRETIQVILWHDLKGCKVETGCFSSVLMLTRTNDNIISIKVKSKQLNDVASRVYELMNTGKKGIVDQEVIGKLSKRQKIIYDSGLLQKSKRGLCNSAISFVPWSKVVSLQFTHGCFRSTVTANTMVMEPPPHEPEEADISDAQAEETLPQEKATEEKPKEGKPSEEESNKIEPKESEPKEHEERPKKDNRESNKEDAKPKKEIAVPDYKMIGISGKDESMEATFNMMMTLMCPDKESAPLEDAPEVRYAKFSNLGILATSRRNKTFIPWASVDFVDWSAPCLGKPTLVITDCIGTRIPLRGVTSENFEKFRALLSKQRGESQAGSTAEVKPIIRKRMKLTGDGVTLTTKSLCSASHQFLPWSEIDAAEMDLGCCGGAIDLITESGTRIRAYKALFGAAAMNEVFARMRIMKYGGASSEVFSDDNELTFAGRIGDPRACVLTNDSLRLVTNRRLCKRLVRVLDLDAITSCEAPSRRVLLVHVRESMNIDGDEEAEGVQPIQVKLYRGEDANDIAAEIVRRVQLRKGTK